MTSCSQISTFIRGRLKKKKSHEIDPLRGGEYPPFRDCMVIWRLGKAQDIISYSQADCKGGGAPLGPSLTVSTFVKFVAFFRPIFLSSDRVVGLGSTITEGSKNLLYKMMHIFHS